MLGSADVDWVRIMQGVYDLLGEVASTTMEWVPAAQGPLVFPTVKETPTTSFQLNDFAVTARSACVHPFIPLASVIDNHATISNPTNGQTVLDAIRAIQPVK